MSPCSATRSRSVKFSSQYLGTSMNHKVCICSTYPFKFRWSRGYICKSSNYYHQIGSIKFSQCFHIFLWLRVWGGQVVVFCQLLHRDPRKLFFFISITTLQSMMCENDCVYHGLKVVFVCLHITLYHYHYYGDLTYKMLVRYILSSVCIRLNPFSQLSFMQYVCF